MAQEYSQIAISEPKPFVKWAGGKRQLMPELEKNFPTKFGTYVEPFLGAGAVLSVTFTALGCKLTTWTYRWMAAWSKWD